jgi:hypothetical protein
MNGPSIRDLVYAIEQSTRCAVNPSVGLPVIPGGLSLPEDLRLFYEVCGGVELFRDEGYSMEIVPPGEFCRANPVIVGDPCEDDQSFDWFIVGRSGLQVVTVDLSAERLGRCYDSFWDRHGLVGECTVIAKDFSEFLVRYFESDGKYLYWLEPDFVNYGDAYDV